MPLDRKSVERAVAQHVQAIQRTGRAVTTEQRQQIRQQHEQLASKVDQKRR